MLRRLIIGLGLLVALQAQSASGPTFEEAVALFQDKDFTGALEIAEPLATAGDARAMAMMGAAYQSGRGVPEDLAKATAWFEQAAAKGHPGAEFSLALIHLEAGDVARGKPLLVKAAAGGNAQAQHNLALLAANGDQPNWKEAVGWFERAALAGFAESQYNLGILYAEGRGVEKNPVKAAEWFSKAASQGLADAALDYGVMVFRGDGVQKDEKIGAQWLVIAARRGNVVAQNRVARLFATGRGVALDPIEAMKWNILAGRGGRPDDWLDEYAAKQPAAKKAEAESRAASFAPETPPPNAE